jgi:L-ribulose-5-phosphate 4-epimerase
MNEKIAKQKVVEAGVRLVENGLIARTWGNVSCRVSDTHFAITPSGRNYLNLTPADIVTVAIADLSYTGSIIPSGEKGIHAEVYHRCPEVNFVIHTHQENASVVSALGVDKIPVSDKFPLLDGEVLCTPYALPGTKKIRQGVAAALQVTDGNALILKNHGTICFGKDEEEAFQVAMELESACGEFIATKYPEPTTSVSTLRSRRTKNGFLVEFPGGECIEADINAPAASFPPDLVHHWAVYRANKKIQVIHHVATPNILAYSRVNSQEPLFPLVDDFAQIIGYQVKTVGENPKEAAAALKHASAVFVQNTGALCCGQSELDVQAVGMILEKCAKASLCGQAFGGVTPIGWLHSKLMRRMYLKKYSKQIG